MERQSPLHQDIRSIHGEHVVYNLTFKFILAKKLLIVFIYAFNRNGEYCLAQLSEDDRWYRATNHGKVNDNTYNLFYVDYGNIEEVPVERIREMRSEFMYPCVTAMCFIDGK